MAQFSANAVPQLVLLLVVSPWIGVTLLLARWRRRRETPLWRFALGNTLVTAFVGTGLLMIALSRSGHDSASSEPLASQAWTVLIRGAPAESPPQLPPWTLSLVLSVGWDELNAGPLLWIPWLFVAALLSIPKGANASSGVLIGLLAAEGCLLLQFAAQDAWTFWGAGEAALLVVWGLVGNWGDTHRRTAAQTLFTWQHTGHLLWMLGLMGLAIIGVWMQWEARGERALIRFSWEHLAPYLTELMTHDLHREAYWQQTAWMVMTALLAGTVLRAGLVPAHHAWTAPLEHAAPPLSALLLGTCGLIGGYGFLRFVAPLVEPDSAAAEGLMLFGGVSALLGGFLTCAAADLRRCAAAWWIAVSGSLWIGLGSGLPDRYESAWAALQAAVGTGVVQFFVLQAIERRSSSDPSSIIHGLQRRYPRLAVGSLAVTLISLCLLPLAWGADFTLGWIASAGWMLASWGLLWRLLSVLYGQALTFALLGAPQVIDVTQQSDHTDFSWSEGAAMVLVLGVAWVPCLLSFGENFQ